MTEQTRTPRLVIHVPHASTSIPPELRDRFLLDDHGLKAEADESADLWTDELAKQAWPDAMRIEASVARIVVDVERYSDDDLEPMATVGRGMIYTHSHDGRPMRRNLGTEEKLKLQRRYYDPHWARLREVAAGAVLVDLHSYPVSPWPIELDAEVARPEIVLGTDPKLTPDDWVGALVAHFEVAGFEVGLNRPYGGVIDAGATAAVMFEIRRDMLGTGPNSPQWARLVATLRSAPMPASS
jgi:N-formylglutamate amidohydrolase